LSLSSLSSLSAADARRVQLAAQGVPRRTLRGRPSAKAVLGVVERQSALQIDSVNVLARAHYVPVFSRLGPYDTALLDRLAFHDRRLFEFWAHEACLLPVELWPYCQWRMREAAENRWYVQMYEAHGPYVERVYQEVVDRGALAASELTEPGERSGAWWGWGAGKRALEYLFRVGRVTVADRRNFERVYDLPSRVLPESVLSAPVPSARDARRSLLLRAARALGVFTFPDLCDYWRMQAAPCKAPFADLVEAGDVVPVDVEGWPAARAGDRAYAAAGAAVPRRGSGGAGGALLSPFDPLLWDRKRTLRVFDFHYRIEIYVPAPKREYGYYVLPFLLGDRFVARVDLKADRAAGALRVLGAWSEPGAVGGGRGRPSKADVAAALGDELLLVASWLGLSAVSVERRGDLAHPALYRYLSTRGRGA
jgi:uncharacterized protein YcaQ